MNYLLDTSVVARITKDAVGARMREIPASQIHSCTALMLEVGWSARNSDDHARRVHQMTIGMQWKAMTSEIEQRAIEIQGLLAQRGQHRSARVVDLLLAATAEAYGLTVLHYDSDYDLIAAATGQPCEWVVPRGSVD